MDYDDIKAGMWVKHKTAHREEIGRVKSHNGIWVFVVYHCGEDWDNYENYTGCATHITNLTKIGDPRK